MLKEIRYAILKTKEFYYRKKWIYYMNKYKSSEANKEYQTMYEWRDKASIYNRKRKIVVERLWELDL